MPRFAYTALTPAGEQVNGEMDAGSEAEAIRRLQGEGLLPIRATPAAGARAGRKPLGREARARFLEELATLVEAGLPLERALALLAGRADRGAQPVRDLSRALRDRVRAGQGLSAALHGEGDPLGEAAAAILAAGEAAGKLGPGLRALAEGERRSAELAASLRGALTYPLVVLCVAAVALLILLGVVLPRFELVFEAMGRPVPPLTRVMLGLSGLLASYGPALLLVGSGVAGWTVWRRGRGGVSDGLAALALRLPGIGGYVRAVLLERSTRALSLLLQSGVPLAEALPLAAKAAAGPVGDAWAGAGTAVRAGRSLSDSLRADGTLPDVAAELAAVGEETGRLGPCLGTLAGLFAADAARMAQRFTSLVAPLLTLVLGVLVGGVVLSLVSAVMELYDLAG